MESIKQSQHMTNKIKKWCDSHFGFHANPSLTKQQNFNKALEMCNNAQNKQPTNLSFHNLCTSNTIPPYTRQLLGLNLKFCLTPKVPRNNVKKTVIQMARSIRTHYYLKENASHNESNYIKQIYVKNKNWNPPPAPLIIEDQLVKFEKHLNDKFQEIIRKRQKINMSNLTTPQLQALSQLKNNKNLIVKPTDKNLGPAILDTLSYVKQVLREHLLTTDYKQLSYQESKNLMDKVKTELKNIISSNTNEFTKPELTYFQRSLNTFHRIPLFYGLPKVHKSPFTLRPVVSTTNSLLAVFSTWLDYRMKDLLPLVKSYIKNSTTIINDLKLLHLPENARIFTADAKSMYTNIATDTGLQAFQEFIHHNVNCIPIHFPTEIFLKILEIVMKNNVFRFADTFWLQLSGTAMGTPAACNYATISYGHHENTKILTTYAPNLLYYRRYIDDIFGIWIPNHTAPENTWATFKDTLNSWGSLEWTTEEPSLHTNFLDLKISIQNQKIITSTYQKEMNLYLYIPPLSAHPNSCFKGLIHGELKRYWLQNSPSEFTKLVAKFIERLLLRGHTIKNLMPILIQAANKIDSDKISYNGNTKNANNSSLFIHWEYQPNGIQGRHIRAIYNDTLAQYIDYDKMTLAVSRPKNLRDILTRAALTLPDNTSVQEIISNLT